MDALSRLLSLHPVHAALDIRCRFGEPWHVAKDGAGAGIAPYHFVLEGSAWLALAGQPPIALQAGDLVLLARGAAHSLYTAAPHAALPVQISSAPGAVSLHFNGAAQAPARTDFLCGQFAFDAPHSSILLQALPELVLVRAADSPESSSLHALAALLRDECGGADGLGQVRDGAQAVVAGLASALFGLALRAWLRQEGPATGLLALLAHPRLHQAVQAMLAQPAQDWSLEGLAAVCHLSRASFARQFRQVAGVTPGEMLQRLRMAEAAHLLGYSKMNAAEIGEAVGYQSEAAFNRVFKKYSGMGPGGYRRQLRGAAR